MKLANLPRNLFCIALLITASLAQSQTVLIETSMGNMTAEMHPDTAPKSVENFMQYVDSGFYNGLIFHRVIPNFMIQGGGHHPDMSEKDGGAPIVNESNNYVKNAFGTLAMARTNEPNSATNQFFINLNNNRNLDYMFGRPGYAVFAHLTEGVNVLQAIGNVPTRQVDYHSDVPVTPVIIKRISRVNTESPSETEQAE